MLTMLTNMPKDVLVQQIKDGLVLLVLGMGTVFVFLVILIYATKIMSKLCMSRDANHPANAKAAAKPAASAPAAKTMAAAPANDDAAVAAAIAAAYDKSRE